MSDYVNAPLLLGYFCVYRPFSLIARGLQIPDSQKSLFSAACWAFNKGPCNGTQYKYKHEWRVQGPPQHHRLQGSQMEAAAEKQDKVDNDPRRLEALLQKVSTPIKL